MTTVVNKHLLPVYDKPMIFYPLSTLIAMGIREILLVTDPRHAESFRLLLGDGSQFGIQIQYSTQDRPLGIAQGLSLAAGFIDEGLTALILGDNIFCGERNLPTISETHNSAVATIFSNEVDDGSSYGVVRTNALGAPTHLVEKPDAGGPAEAVAGLYVYPPDVLERAGSLHLSPRGEYEITDLNQQYLEESRLVLRRLPNDIVWFDAGTIESLSEASTYVQNQQDSSRALVGSPELAAWHRGFVDDGELQSLVENHGMTKYGRLLDLALLGSK